MKVIFLYPSYFTALQGMFGTTGLKGRLLIQYTTVVIVWSPYTTLMKGCAVYTTAVKECILILYSGTALYCLLYCTLKCTVLLTVLYC